MTRIYSLGLLPPTMIAMEGEDIVAATGRMPRACRAQEQHCLFPHGARVQQVSQGCITL